jgi:hypothetical protein
VIRGEELQLFPLVDGSFSAGGQEVVKNVEMQLDYLISP